MSDRTLVVHQATLQSMADALRAATETVEGFMTDLTTAVDAQTVGWSEETPSRVAQRAHARRLADDVTALRTALGRIADELDTHREKTHDTEVENIAVIG